MGDVFISYSRRDAAFVQQLNTAFVGANRVVWIDWQSIPRGEAWEHEIELGIENSDTFLCVISEHWLTSEICHRELTYAREQHKRIFPLIRQRVEGDVESGVQKVWREAPYAPAAQENWDYIRHLNWVFFDVETRFQTEFIALLKALDEDQPHIKAHTRYQNRALEWERSECNPSFLMDGDELVFAENWLSAADQDQKEPTPSTVQRQYIQSSRAAEKVRTAQALAREQRTRNFRRASVTLAIFTGLALFAAIWAGLRSADALRQVDEAHSTATVIGGQIQTNAARLESQRLAAEASDILNDPQGNFETAALLSIQALNTGYSAQADATLAIALNRLYTRQIFVGHTDAVTSVAISPDGQTLLTASWDGSARLWDVQTGKELRLLGAYLAIQGAVFSPDGRFFVSWGSGPIVRLWDMETGNVTREFYGHTDVVTSVAFSPDGRTLLSSSRDGTVRLWDIETSWVLQTFTGHTNVVNSVSYSPDGRYALSGSSDTTVRLWDIETGAEIRRFEGHTNIVQSVAFSPDGAWVLSGSNDTTARLWQTANGQEIQRLEGHTSAVNGVAFSPDGRLVLTGSDDATARLWDSTTGSLLNTLNGDSEWIKCVAFSPTGDFVATGGRDNTARIWSLEPRSPFPIFQGHTGAIRTLHVTPDGSALVTGSDDNTIRWWNIQTGEELKSLRINPDDTLMLADFVLSPDGRQLLVGRWDKTAELWDIETGEVVQTFRGHTSWVMGVAFSPDGRSVLTGSTDETSRLWDAQSGQLIRTFSNTGTLVTFSPDGQIILTEGPFMENTARLWDAQTGELLQELVGHTDAIRSASFSPDGRYILTSSDDFTTRLWDAQTGRQIQLYRDSASRYAMISAAMSQDGRYVLTGSADNVARLWDKATGQIVRVLSGHRNEVTGVAFSPDGRLAITSSGEMNGDDFTVRLWHTDVREYVGYACTRVFRDFIVNGNFDERKQFGLDDAATCP